MAVTYNPIGAENPVVAGLAVLTLVLNAALISTLVYYILQKTGLSDSLADKWHGFMGEASTPIKDTKDFLSSNYKTLSLIVAAGATSGSLYMSNVLGWEPCLLCWYQRILVYPIVVLTAVAVLFEKDDVREYVMPLAMIGLPISVYHSLVQRYSQFHSAGCSIVEVSCSTSYTFWFGYITIPVMAATALATVLVLMWRFSEN
ncbi:disulfide bond formation protein B [Candidatus Nanohalococcus occultus]|uniref:Disulfide bond formation protein DsbB n=1 Tax=Candidatus Nanohalococcus occultus TaxID=2978047 RepID=A0ABY8CF23_9ARCH|nr:Disulfide bond formation protein DsbB [Candidatus Nanohaloarchaeota archaeon SVXNc]